jgi:cytochrome P450
MSGNYLAEFDAAHDSEKQALVNRWIKEEPLAFFKQLREHRPILETPECFLVSRYADVCEVLKSSDVFSTQLYRDNIYTSPRNAGHFFAHDNTDLHRYEKSIMQTVLSRDDLVGIRDITVKNARKVIAQAQAQGNLELVGDYSRKIPIIIAQEYFGFSGVSQAQLQRWAAVSQQQTFFNHHFNLYSSEQSQEIAKQYSKVSKEIIVYLKKLLLKKWFAVKVSDRVMSPLGFSKDDIAKRLLRVNAENLESPEDFSLLRVGVNLVGLLAGSVENISVALVNAIQFLLKNPEYLSQAKEISINNKAESLNNLVWELLRFAPITPYLFRQTTKEVVLGSEPSTTIPKGKTVLALTQSAMFDESVDKDLQLFNPEREAQHSLCSPLAYGMGSHECVGKYLAMTIIPVMLRELLLCDELTITAAVDYQGGPFPESCHLSFKR